MEIRDLEIRVEKELNDRKLWFEEVSVRPVTTTEHKFVIKVYGLRGDWKHDHLFLDNIMESTFGEVWTSGEKVTESDGSDYYTADHTYLIDLKEDLV